MRKNKIPRLLFENLESRVLLSSTTPVGINIEPLSDWARSFMFVDAMKSSREFGSAAAPWDQNAPVDANGWPTSDFGACVITVNSPQLAIQDFPPIDGTYHLVATGDADIAPAGGSQLTVSNRNYDPVSNTLTADITVAPGATTLYLSFTNTSNGTGGAGLENIKLIRPGYAANTTQTFTTAFINSLDPFQTLRFMDFSATNNNSIVNWSDRAQPTDAIQTTGKGAAWEYAIQLADQTNKDLWINIPAQASDDYITSLATLLKNSLNPGLHVYLEYSNEVWNSGFQQYFTNSAAALAEEAANPGATGLNYDNADNPTEWAWRRVVEQLEHDQSLFAGVFGQAAVGGGDATTVRPVLASQAANPFILRDQMDYITHFYGNPSQTIYAVAGAPYIGIGDLSNSPTLTTDQVISALQNSIAGMQDNLQRYDALASFYGLKNLCYEAGTALQGDTLGNFLAAKLPANYDPRIADVLTQYLTTAYAQGADQLMYYNASGTDATFGSWGLTEDIYNLTGYKYSAVAQFANQTRPALTAGATLPATGALTIDAGSYTADQWESTGTGGDINFPGPGNTYDYLLNSSDGSAATVALSLGSASDSAQIQVLLDNQTITTLNIPNTGDISNFLTLPALNLAPGNAAQSLAPGLHTLRLVVLTPGVTIHSLTFQTAPAPVPTGLIVSNASTSQVQLTWNNFAGQTGYLIERSPDGSSSWTQIASSVLTGDINHDGSVDGGDFDIWLAHLGAANPTWQDGDLNGDGSVDGADFDIWFTHIGLTNSAAPNTFTDTNLQPGTTYYYRVRATTAQAISPYSNIIAAATLPASAPAAQVASTTLPASASPAVIVASQLPTTPDNSFLITTAPVSAPSIPNAALLPDTRYYYRLSAHDAYSPLSDTAISPRTRR